MSIPVILELLARENPNVKKTLADIGQAARDTFAGIKGDLIPPNTLERTKLATQLLADMQRETVLVAGDLVNVRDRMNEVAKTPGLGAQAASYQSIQAELKRIGAASEDVRRVNPQLEASYKSLTQSAEEGLKRVADRSRNLADLGGIITTAFAGTGTVMAGLATGALMVAGNFEALKAKLVSVTGSVVEADKKFEFAKNLAASTPFDVEGVVGATAIIEGFKLKSEELLPVAANLASAMGTDLKDATLVLSKAASGGAEGFESLRNEYAVSNKALGEYGAAVNKTTGELSHLEKDTERNRQALIKLIQTRYGDAVARQSDTLKGAMSNAGDAVKNLGASFGQSLIPLATGAAKGFAFFADTVNAIPGPLKAIAAVAVVAIAGIAGVGAAAVGSVTALLLLQAQLIGIGAETGVAAVGLELVSGALAQLGAEAAFVQAELIPLAIAAAPFLAVLALIAAGAGVAALAINHMEQQHIKAGNAIAASSREFASANKDLRAGIELINEASGASAKQVTIVAGSANQVRQIHEALANLPVLALAGAMEKAGVNVESFKTQLDVSTKSLKTQRGLLGEYKAELESLQKVDPITGQIYISPENIARVQEINQQIQFLNVLLGKTAANKSLAAGVLDKFSDLQARLQPLIDSTKELGVSLDLSKNVGTTQALNTALAGAQAQIKANAAQAEVGSANLDVLLQKLAALGKGPNFDLARQLILDQIKLIQTKDGIEQTIATNAANRDKAAVDALELEFRRRKALGQAQLQDELAFINQRLAAVATGTEEEVALLERKAAKEKEIAEKAKEASKKQLDDLLAVGKNAVTTAELGNTEGTGEAKSKLESLNTVIAAHIAEAVNSTQKLAAVNAGINSIQRARQQGLLEEEAAQSQINSLTNQKAQLEKSISDEKLKQAQVIAGLEQTNAEQELTMLQARAAAGEKLDKEILAKQQQILDGKLAIIEAERVAAINAAQGSADAIEGINKAADLKRTNVENADLLRRMGDFAKTESAQDKSLSKQESRFLQSQAKMSNSPIRSISEAFSGPGAFSLPGFSLDEDLHTMAAPARKVSAFQRAKEGQQAAGGGDNTLANSINAAERAKKNPFNGPRPKDGALESAAAAASSVVVSIYVNNAKIGSGEPEITECVHKVLKRVAGDVKLKGGGK